MCEGMYLCFLFGMKQPDPPLQRLLLWQGREGLVQRLVVAVSQDVKDFETKNQKFTSTCYLDIVTNSLQVYIYRKHKVSYRPMLLESHCEWN